jgi:cell division protein FtsB
MLIRPRLWIAVLVALLGLMQYRLWIADGSVPGAHRLQEQVQQEKTQVAHLQARNDAMKEEIANLKSGTAALGGRARTELGMIKRGESFYLLVGGNKGPETAPSSAAQ